MLWKESTTGIFETYFWLNQNTTKGFLETLRMKTMNGFPKYQMTLDVFWHGFDKRTTFEALVWFEHGNMP